MSEVLEQPPEDEGDNSEAGGGKPASPIKEGEISDTVELEEDDYEDDGEEAKKLWLTQSRHR